MSEGLLEKTQNMVETMKEKLGLGDAKYSTSGYEVLECCREDGRIITAEPVYTGTERRLSCDHLGQIRETGFDEEQFREQLSLGPQM